MNLDVEIFRVLNNSVTNHWVASIAIFCARFLPYLMLLYFVLIVWQRTDLNKKFFIFYPIAVALVSRFVFAEIIKLVAERGRPFVDLAGVHQLIPESGYSMPSGHASFFFAFALSVYLVDKRMGSIFLGLTVLLSVARVFVGVHYPSDILVGMALGLAVAYTIWKLWGWRYFQSRSR